MSANREPNIHRAYNIKIQAVEDYLSNKKTKSYKQIGMKYGVSDTTVWKWVKLHANGKLKPRAPSNAHATKIKQSIEILEERIDTLIMMIFRLQRMCMLMAFVYALPQIYKAIEYILNYARDR